MLDFTSALYLGMRHASDELGPWRQLTTGVPAALREPAAARPAAAGLAQLTGCEDGALARSTLHAFWDLFPLLVRGQRGHGGVAIWTDGGTYPVARWAMERAAARGVPSATFRHHRPDHLWQVARDGARRGRRPLVVADGACAGCGQPAPLDDYLEIVERLDGQLLLDDTQALGLLGPEGGGSLRRVARPQRRRRAVLVVSLAKAFGAPLAFAGGPAAEVAAYRTGGETRMHLSPPSLADLHAAWRALELNAVDGAARRAGLQANIDRFRRGLAALGLAVEMAVPPHLPLLPFHPVQPVPPVPRVPAETLHRSLQRQGVRAVLHRSCDGQPRVSFVITAAHRPQEIDRALAALGRALGTALSGEVEWSLPPVILPTATPAFGNPIEPWVRGMVERATR